MRGEKKKREDATLSREIDGKKKNGSTCRKRKKGGEEGRFRSLKKREKKE